MDALSENTTDRVRRHTSAGARWAIDAKTRRNIRTFVHKTPIEVSERIAALEKEWDVERTLETNASLVALLGAALGTAFRRRWFWLTGGVLTFLFQHATSGWCPPLPVLRRLGVRTRNEIDQEKYALKAARGDFRGAKGEPLSADLVVEAVTFGESRGTFEREPDRVRRYTAASVLRRLDQAVVDRVRGFAGQAPEVITERIQELRREWSIERYLQINAAAVGLTTSLLAVTSDRRKWGYATCAGLALFLFHAVEGYDASLPLLRRRGLRTRAEINTEIYALKVLRGDFENVGADGDAADTAIEAVGA